MYRNANKTSCNRCSTFWILQTASLTHRPQFCNCDTATQNWITKPTVDEGNIKTFWNDLVPVSVNGNHQNISLSKMRILFYIEWSLRLIGWVIRNFFSWVQNGSYNKTDLVFFKLKLSGWFWDWFLLQLFLIHNILKGLFSASDVSFNLDFFRWMFEKVPQNIIKWYEKLIAVLLLLFSILSQKLLFQFERTIALKKKHCCF